MIKKIIYINYEKYSWKLGQDYMVDYLINQRICIEYWDITQLITGEIHTADLDFISIIHTYKELDKKLIIDNKNDVLIILLFNLDGNSIKLYRHINKFNPKKAFFSWGMWPSPYNSTVTKIQSKRINMYSLKVLLLNRISKFYEKIGYIKEFDYVFAAGSIASKKFHKAIIKQVNLPDYNTFINIKDDVQPFIAGDYAIFLDNNAAFHSDVELLGSKLINAEIYFNEINVFFEKIERQFGIEIIIAAHPSSNYTPNAFNGRRILKNKTGQLVRDSKLVLASISTSISYAILFNKPITFFYTQDMVNNYYLFGYPDMCIYLSDYLKCSVYNISENYNLDSFPLNIPENIRIKFIKDYYTSDESQSKSNEMLFSQYLNEI